MSVRFCSLLSGAQKRAKKKKKTDSCLLNTSLISTYMQKKDDSENMLAEDNQNENPFNIGDPLSTSITEVEDNSFLNNAEKDPIPLNSNHDVTDNNAENFTPFKPRSNPEAEPDNNEHLVFDARRKFPTNRGHFMENITDPDLKRHIMQHDGMQTDRIL